MKERGLQIVVVGCMPGSWRPPASMTSSPWRPRWPRSEGDIDLNQRLVRDGETIATLEVKAAFTDRSAAPEVPVVQRWP